MNLRWVEKVDGTRVLQYMHAEDATGKGCPWTDIPTVKEERKPREFWIYKSKVHEHWLAYETEPAKDRNAFKVREVIKDEK